MLETLTIITLATLWLIFFRPGKTPPLESQLKIERPGRYQIVLAPKLNLAQPFLEAIAQRFAAQDSTLNGAMQCFAVRDKHVSAHGSAVYLLAISARNGMLYFQGTPPLSDDPGNYLETIRKFAKEVLMPEAGSGKPGPQGAASIVDAVNAVAQQHGIEIEHLTD
ncbi:hypothetical protein [Sideroxydans lithotrophicus]|uniref:Uncharacterized protein n=1 Tax=Sideroxydans lithotrophicus (strain ES-1) TaxID=580332 RepID=D5CNI8_SIDLE|nr:hypothetical protein [Sideroxydans lithotrophicus]ADE10901.1 hypothetical protein Slit_0661 [Sideroxydans lithotrophicus ES-1]